MESAQGESLLKPWRLAALLLGATIVAAAPADEASPSQVNAELFQFSGDWRQIAKQRNGEPLAVDKLVMSFTRENYVAKAYSSLKDFKVVEQGTIAIDPTRQPKAYDAYMTGDFPDKGKIYRGIYKIEGNFLTTCVHLVAGKPAPMNFATTPGSDFQLIVWERTLEGKVLAEWIDEITNRDKNVRQNALGCVGALGTGAKDAGPAVTAVTAALKDPEPAVRMRAFFALMRLGKKAAAAIPALLEFVESKDSSDRWTAAETLETLGPDAAVGVPALVKMAGDSDPSTRLKLIQMFGRLQGTAAAAAPYLVNALKDPDRQVRLQAACSLTSVGKDQLKAMPVLTDLLKTSTSASDYGLTTLALSRLGADAVPILIDALADTTNKYRNDAVVALWIIGPPAAEPAIPAMIATLNDKDPVMQSSAETGLSQMGAAAIEPLGKVLRQGADLSTKMRAIRALAVIGRKSGDRVLPVLQVALTDQSAPTREAAVCGIGLLGTTARSAAAPLAPLLKDSEALVRWRTAIALTQVGAGDNTLLPVLLEVLGSSNKELRPQAAEALGRLGAQAKSAVPDLVRSLKQQDANLCPAAIAALGAMGADAKEAIPALIAAMDSKGFDLNVIAVALRDIGPDAIDPLIKSLGAASALQREGAGVTLALFGFRAKSALPALTVALKDPDNNVAMQAAKTIQKIELDVALKALVQ